MYGKYLLFTRILFTSFVLSPTAGSASVASEYCATVCVAETNSTDALSVKEHDRLHFLTSPPSVTCFHSGKPLWKNRTVMRSGRLVPFTNSHRPSMPAVVLIRIGRNFRPVRLEDPHDSSPASPSTQTSRVLDMRGRLSNQSVNAITPAPAMPSSIQSAFCHPGVGGYCMVTSRTVWSATACFSVSSGASLTARR